MILIWNRICSNFCFVYLFYSHLQANGDAAVGKYVAGSVAGVGADAGLFVANHAY